MEAVYYVYLPLTEEFPGALERFYSSVEGPLKAVRLFPRYAPDRRALALCAEAIRKSDTPWARSIVVSNVVYDTGFLERREMKSAELIVLASSRFHSIEETPLINTGCLLCGHGSERAKIGRLQPTSAIGWRFGFTNTGRLVAHVDILEAMLAEGISGFSWVPLPSLNDDKYILKVWCGCIERARDHMIAALPERLSGARVLAGEHTMFVIMTKECFGSVAGRKAHRVLTKLHADDHISYHAIPPGRALGRRKSARWLELVVDGPALRERELNRYDRRDMCPVCGEGALRPKSILKVARDSWNGADVCRTDADRICVTPRVVRFLEQFGSVRSERVQLV